VREIKFVRINARSLHEKFMVLDWNNIGGNTIADLKKVCEECHISVAAPRGKPEYVAAVTAYRNSQTGSLAHSPAPKGARVSPSSGRASTKGRAKSKLTKAIESPSVIVASLICIASLIWIVIQLQ
jgi:hypothetical protein